MERYVTDSLREFINLLTQNTEVLIPSLVFINLGIVSILFTRRFYDFALIILFPFVGGLWLGLNVDLKLLTVVLVSFALSIPGLLPVLLRDPKFLPIVAGSATFYSTVSYVYGTFLKEAEGKELAYLLLGQTLFLGYVFWLYRKGEKEEEEERERKERYAKVLMRSYDSPLILPPSVGVVKKYSEEERQKELYELIMRDILEKKVDDETFNAIEQIKDRNLREKLLKEAYEAKIEVEKRKAYEEDDYDEGYSDGFASGYAAGSDS